MDTSVLESDNERLNSSNLDFSFKEPYPEEKLSEGFINLITEYKTISLNERSKNSDTFIKVSEVLGSVAFAYERIRNAIDYKGEHLLRRNAMERILKRKIWEKPGGKNEELSESLIKELIWARYLKNNSVPKRKATNVSNIISKYLRVFDMAGGLSNYPIHDKQKIKDWFMEVASCEIESALSSESGYMESLGRAAFFWFKENFEWQDSGLSEDEKDVQVFIAFLKCVAKSDLAALRFFLLKVYYPDWVKIDESYLDRVFYPILEVRKEIEKHLNSSLQPRLYRFVQKHSAAFLILKEVVEENLVDAQYVLSDPLSLEKQIKKVCKKKYDEIREKVNTGVKRSIVYIFATKLIFAFLIEVPFETIFLDNINYLALGINVSVPPILMFLIGMSIRRPGEENTLRIIDKIKSFVYAQRDEEKTTFSLIPKKRKNIMSQIFLALYGLLFLISFGGITVLLFDASFNLLSAGIFFVFISLVLLFSYRIRFTASELNVTGEKEGFLSHLFTNLTLPFLNLGVLLSKGLSKINFLVILMDFLIEAPLKSIIGVFEEWTSFIREKREEVVEVPGQ